MAFSSSASAGPNAAPVVVTIPNNNNELVDNNINKKNKNTEYFVAAPPPLVHQRKEYLYPVAMPMKTDTTPMMPPSPPCTNPTTNSSILLELNVQYDHPTIAKDPNVLSTDDYHGFCTICRPITTSTPAVIDENNNNADTQTNDKNKSDLIFYRPQMALYKVLQEGAGIIANDAQKDNEQDGTTRTQTRAATSTTSATTTKATATPTTPTSPSTTDMTKHHSNTHARVTVPNHLLPYVTLYGPQKQALWSLTSKDWHTMDFISTQLEKVITLTTSTSLFSFVWINHKTYQWQLVPAAAKNQHKQHPYDLRCYHNDKLIAEFVDSRFIQWTEQPRKFDLVHDIQLTSFLLLSGLLIHEHLGSILRSLGGGPEAVQLMTDPTFATTAMMDDDDDNSLGSFYGEREYADQGLVDGQHASTNRWYSSHSGALGGHHHHGSAGSVKSIELDPGCMRCFWGYGFWWTWCPCCMPGGWFDRLWINCRLHRRKMANNTNTSMSRSRQRRQRGWQQHHPEQY
ncbi:hypothetical protein BDA99DRAFT_543529 [Phascolomyces articulosus]|uniref:Uncharacterized protein n=1 Tax=Phascolomyces articulosus TaxID=60185 RepID=A0AAD5JXW6_9FUNG|nr:hypothetical protein BDA99DRAFT_543529 [Phascolomyces articulosus]